MKKTLTIITGVIALIGIILLSRPSPLEVDIRLVERKTVREYVVEEAKTRLAEEFHASMPFSGTVERISIITGNYVAKGDVLARIDTFPLQQEIKVMEASIAQTRARIVGVDMGKPRSEDIESARIRMLEMRDNEAMARKDRRIADVNAENARVDYERFVTLREQGTVSQSVYDEAHRNFETLQQTRERAVLAEDAARKSLAAAELSYQRIRDSIDDNEYQRDVFEAEITALEARLNMLLQDYEKAEIRSPISGYILEKHVEDRQWLVGGTLLLTLGNPESIEIESDILSEEIRTVFEGAFVEITGKSLEQKIIPGKVSRIYPSGFVKISALGIEQQRVRTIIEFDNSELGLRPGVSLDVHIVTAESVDTLAVPERAVFRMQENYALFAVRDNRAVLTLVEVGLRNDDWVEILSGLDEGDMIIVDPDNQLADGMLVAQR